MTGGEPGGERENGAGSGAPSPGAPAADPPGPLSRLLEELAASPGEELLAAWGQELRAGDRLDRFEIVAVLGRGGFGTVYEAQDGELGRRVAIKTLRPGRAGKEFSAGWIRKEAEAVARLGHPGIVMVHDVCNCASGPYMVMELLRGQTLEERLATGPLPPAEAQRIAEEMAKALAHAHGRGVLHRDLKPANVFLCEDGGVKLLDFGLAHLLGQPNEGSGGTPAYMAPEQARGERVDERADVFAAGKVLGETLGDRAPRRLAEAVRIATDPDPAARPRDGTAWLELLERTRRAGERARRLRVAAAISAGLVAVLAAAGLAGWSLWGRVPAPGPDGRVTVAVADFVNETREPELDGLSGQLITSLEQSQRLRVLTRSRMVDVLRQLGKPTVPVVDEVLGREMALAAGVRALVVASIRRFDRLYAIDLKVLDPATSEYFFTLKEEREGKGAIPGMLDRLSERAREKLREAPAKVAAARIAIAESTTASHEAWRLYFEGLKRESEADNWAATRSYEKAIAIDPRFAMAQYRIAYLGEFTGYPAKLKREAMEAAIREIDRVPAKEKLLFHAWKAHLDGRDADAHALYAQAAEAYPLDKEVLYLAGDLYLHAGQATEALPWFEKAVALDPMWLDAEWHIINDTLPLLGRADEALARARKLAARSPGPTTTKILRTALAEAGRRDEALELARAQAATDPSWQAQRGLGVNLMMTDRFEEAEAIFRRHAAPSVASEERLEAIVYLVCAVAAQGRRSEALQLTAILRNMPETFFRGKPIQHHWIRWSLLMDGPDHRAALREGEIIRGWNFGGAGGLFTGYLILGEDGLAAAVEPLIEEPWLRELYEALSAWRRGEHGVAIDRIRAIRERTLFTRAFLSWWLAYVAFDAGRDAEAIAATEIYAKSANELSPWRSWGLARLLYRTALARERAGDRAGARSTVERMLGWWKRADPDLPLLTETRALCRKLGCDAPGMGGARPVSAARPAGASP